MSRTLLDRLVHLVATPSVSKQEHSIASLVVSELESAGIATIRSGNNVWCEIGDQPRPRLLLNSHLDTVPAGKNWTGDPWKPHVERGRVTGLGANDAKGCVAAMIDAALAARRDLDNVGGLHGKLVLALTAEEENSGAGLSEIIERLKPIDAAIVGEPTALVPMIAQRGLLILRCVAHGRSGHPANTPSDSADNAILTAAGDIARLRDFDWGPAHPLLGRTHAHATQINGGVSRNVIPDACEFFVDVRTTPGLSHAQLVERVRAALRSEVLVHSDRLVPVQTDARHAVVRAVLAALPDARPQGSPAMSDMVFLDGVPAVKIGPGDTTRSHTPDEYILVEELERGAAAYTQVVRHFFRLAAEQPAVARTSTARDVAARASAAP
ncbi:MAG: Succinyl-diaminopimelate desuccinylase [Phycisphaerae bacterium]|nr:Succinyl-diaminopimelate desuccinylase [Phycisphaerae bacterium]